MRLVLPRPILQSALILTLTLDTATQRFFEAQRRRWFPPALNFIPAHVTLFHHLPGDRLAEICLALGTACASQMPVPFAVAEIRFLGRGVAYGLRSEEAARFRAKLAATWAAEWATTELTAQDRQAWRPHVTIQNKVDPAEARALHANLTADFVPFDGLATGVAVWRYLGGPWAHEARIPFAG